MPKSPINFRTAFYTLRRDGTIRFADFNCVDTNLGAMMEPALVNEAVQPIIDIDLDEISINRLEQIDEAAAPGVYGTWGNQVPANYNTL